MSKNIVIIGAGGHAKIVVDIIERTGDIIYGLTDVNYLEKRECMGYPIIGNDEILQSVISNEIKFAAMGIGHVGYPDSRNKSYQYAQKIGYIFPVLVHPSAVIANTAIIGEGSVCAAHSTVNVDARIGKICIVNSAAVIEHDVQMEDGVHVAPHAVVLGEAHIGKNSFIGAGSVILQGIRIGKNCIIGAGSVVLHNVDDDCVVVGNPGRIIKRR